MTDFFKAPMALVRHAGGTVVDANASAKVQRLSNLQAPIMVLNGHEGEIFAGQFSPDGACLATAGYDMQIFLWNVYGECENFAVLRGHKGAIMDLKFNTDSSAILTASTDKTVRIWDMETGACSRNFHHTEIVNAVHVARRGPQLVTTASDDGNLRVFDMRSKQPAKVYNTKFPQTAVSFNDNTDIVLGSGVNNQIQAWDMRRDDVTFVLNSHQDTVTSLALSPNGNYLLSNSMDCSLKQWDIRPYVAGQRLMANYYGHQHNFEKNLLKCSWSPCGNFVSAGSADRYTYVWQTSNKRILYKLPGHHGSVNATDFHPNESILLSAGSDKRVFLGEIALSGGL